MSKEPSQPIRIITTTPLLLAGRNRTYKLGPDTRSNMKELWVAFMEDFGKIEGQVGFTAYGVCHSFSNGLMDYMCAVEVKDQGQVPGYLYTLTIPSRKTAVFLHEGPIEKISETWARIFSEWLPTAKLEVANGAQFEIYGEDFYADDAASKVEIHIPVK